MKRFLVVLCVICMSLSLTGCAQKIEENGKNQVEIVSEQLTGTWISHDSKNVYSKWTFFDGTYTLEVYVDGPKKPNHNSGTYTIGSEAIYTKLSSDGKEVKGEIPYSIVDGTLVLTGLNGALTKEK